MSMPGLSAPVLPSLSQPPRAEAAGGEAVRRPEGPDGPDSEEVKRHLSHSFNTFIWLYAQFN